MEFSRSGREHSSNIGYRLEYERIQEGDKIGVDLEIFPLRESDKHDFEIQTPGATKTSETEDGYRLIFDFNQISDAWIEIKNPANANPKASIKLEIPQPRIFVICEAILEERGFYGHEEWIKENLADERDGYHLLNFRAKSEKILTFKDHVTVLSFLSDQHPRVGKVIADNFPGYFENRILNGSEPQSITSFRDLKFKIDLFNQQDFLRSVDYNDVLKRTLLEIYQRQRNSGFDYVEHLLNRVITTTDSHLKYLDRDVISLYLSCLIQGEKIKTSVELFSGWKPYSQSPDGKHQETITRIEKRLQGENVGPGDFAEYLYYVGRHQVEHSAAKGTLPLFESSYENLDSSRQIFRFAKFWALLREGQQEFHDDNRKAREAFDEAIRTIEPIADEGEIQDWRKEALSRKYRAIVNEYETESGAETAIEYLTHFVEDDLSDLESDSELLFQVKALRHDLISKENIRNSAVDHARENIEKAIELYSQANLSKPQARIYARRQQLEGFIDELNLEFDHASEKYEIVSDIYSESLGEDDLASKYEDMTYICTSKSLLLNRKPAEAIKHLKSCSGVDDQVANQVEALSEISNQLQNYNQGIVSSSEIRPSDDIVVECVDGLLKAEYDLNETKSVIYAAQFLRQYGFSTDLIDSMIEIALKESFAPTPVETNLDHDKRVKEREKDLLLNISLDEVWQSKLPAHIHYQIEKLKIQEISITGDHSSLLKELTTTLEVFLVVVAEYYSGIVHDEIHESISPIDDATLGQLVSFVQELPSDTLPIVDELKQEFSEDDLPKNRDIPETRNAGSHGSELRTTESAYEETKDKLIGIFRKIAPYSPVIVEVEDKNPFGPCVCILHWGGLKKRIWLDTDMELEIGDLYYLPPGEIDNDHIAKVEPESIIECRAERARGVRSVLGNLEPDI